MATSLDGKLVVAISSRALFDFEEENHVFEQGDDRAYMQLQLTRLDEPAKPGVAFSLVKKLLAFNSPDRQQVEVVILSRNDPVSGMRVFRSAKHYGLAIQRGSFTRGRPPWRYLRPLHANLFLSTHLSDVRDALAAGVPAAQVYPHSAQASADHPHELRIAFDGDGDRVLFIDDQGELVDGDELLFIIAQHRHRMQGGCTGVAGTLMSNLGLELALAEMHIPFARTKVGDRYVVEAMKENNWSLGGEGSGHVLCSDLNTTGDGIVSALQVLRAVVDSGKTLRELKAGMNKLPQLMINVRLPRKMDISADQDINRAVADAEKKLAGRGRVLLRPSGTEPLIRVMVEGEDSALVESCAKAIAEIVEHRVSTVKS